MRPLAAPLAFVLSTVGLAVACHGPGTAPAPETPPATPSGSATGAPTTPAPATTASAAASPPVDGEPLRLQAPTSTADLEAMFGDARCLGLSADGTTSACVEGELDMGFIDLSLVLRDGSGAPVTTIPLYSGRSGFEAKAVKADGYRRANEALAAGDFRVAPVHPLTGPGAPALDGTTLTVASSQTEVPPVPTFAPTPKLEKAAAECCAWRPTQALKAGGRVLVRLERRCRWGRDGAPPACQDADYNEENDGAAYHVVIVP